MTIKQQHCTSCLLLCHDNCAMKCMVIQVFEGNNGPSLVTCRKGSVLGSVMYATRHDCVQDCTDHCVSHPFCPESASAGTWLCKRVLSKKPKDQPMMMKLLQLQFTAQVCTGCNCGNNLPQETIAVTTWLVVQGT